MIATREEMKAAKVPLPFRNYCAHLLIPLNECRKARATLGGGKGVGSGSGKGEGRGMDRSGRVSRRGPERRPLSGTCPERDLVSSGKRPSLPSVSCAQATFYSPFQCSDLRHAYEKCEFDECGPPARPPALGRVRRRSNAPPRSFPP